MRVIVCGGRDFRSPAKVWRELDKIHAEIGITALMQGGARGVDTFAREWAATKLGIKRFVCEADWAAYGLSAGPRRNARMLEWKPDFVIAFPGGRGTANMVHQARVAGVEVREVSPETAMRLVRVIGPHFVAGFETDGIVRRAAPILKYLIGKTDTEARAYIHSKGWIASKL